MIYLQAISSSDFLGPQVGNRRFWIVKESKAAPADASPARASMLLLSLLIRINPVNDAPHGGAA